MGKPSVDLTGQRFGELVVIGFAGRQRSNQTWRCKCACGSETVKLGYNLKNGHTASCGCRAMRWRKSGDMNRSHGMRRTRTYRIWTGMVSRCTNPNHQAYSFYGGRGITVCERWLKFENFHSDMGEAPPDRSIDRINNDGGYEPGNCRWATSTEQRWNRRAAQGGWTQSPETIRKRVESRRRGRLKWVG